MSIDGQGSIDRRPTSLLLRIKLYPLVYMMMVASFIAGSYATMPAGQAQKIYDAFSEISKSLVANATGVDDVTYRLLYHNVTVLLPSVLPFIGMLMSLWITYSTGQVLSAISQVSRQSKYQLLIFTWSSAHTWLELLAITVASTESIILGMAILRKSLKDELGLSISSIILAISLLALAASLESVAVMSANALQP